MSEPAGGESDSTIPSRLPGAPGFDRLAPGRPFAGPGTPRGSPRRASRRPLTAPVESGRRARAHGHPDPASVAGCSTSFAAWAEQAALDWFTVERIDETTFHTPGHSPGHIAFHEPEREYLVTGDVLYRGTLHASYESTDPVAFARSIDKLCELDRVATILPGHNEFSLARDDLALAQASFHAIERKGALHHGGGLHEFGPISIRF